MNALPIQISVASQILHGVGLAWGLKLQKKDGVVLTYFGDGATSEGAFHEAANFAGAFHVPAVLLCVNNGWAISTPRSRQTAAKTIAQKAEAYGFPGVQIDGNDPLSVYEAVREAVERARRGDGPTLIEAVTYRLGAHTTADEPTRYRSAEELQEWQAKDPIPRFGELLKQRGLWDAKREAAMEEEIEQQIAEFSAEADAEPPPPADGFFEHVYASPIPKLQQQREAFNEWRAAGEGR
jgi:TPP-dependent pyruvate/acetoin dehydrogenase alpha subunit